jgi:hypothetical protein
MPILCEHCEAKYNNEVKVQKKIAARLACSLQDKRMEAWRFRNCRPKPDRCYLRCDACEAKKMNEQFEYENKLDEMRGVFLRCLEDNDAEALAYMKMIRDDIQMNRYKSPSYFADVCPAMCKALEAIHQSNAPNPKYTICIIMADLADTLIKWETEA